MTKTPDEVKVFLLAYVTITGGVVNLPDSDREGTIFAFKCVLTC
jgi:hypothetical protein